MLCRDVVAGALGAVIDKLSSRNKGREVENAEGGGRGETVTRNHSRDGSKPGRANGRGRSRQDSFGDVWPILVMEDDVRGSTR